MIFQKKKDKNKAPEQIDFQRLPRHIAIIMDGNGRWAKQHGLPRTAGHAAGAETFREIATYCQKIGIEYLTIYAFSTENWKRAKEEVDTIMGLLERYLMEALQKMRWDNLRVRFFGDLSPLSPRLRTLAAQIKEISKQTSGMQVNICLNYGGRSEILRAARTFGEDCRQGRRLPEDLTEEQFSTYLDSSGIPDPDLIIRPSGEYRISNFLLWQCAYTEFYFTKVFWPDFDRKELSRALMNYQKRSRRFGGA